MAVWLERTGDPFWLEPNRRESSTKPTHASGLALSLAILVYVRGVNIFGLPTRPLGDKMPSFTLEIHRCPSLPWKTSLLVW